MKSPKAKIKKVAQENLGFESLRPGQKEAVSAILDGHDTLVVQPTGSGKSAIYQIAGLLIEGATLIVSPLIALQKDQVDAIAGQNSADALAVNSTQRVSEIREGLQKVEQGEVEYIFMSPEQLAKPETLETLKAANISLFVVDEAHCISEWGHEFRPDYLQLGKVVDALGHPHVLAMTATATERVREEIVSRLHMRDPKIFVHGFDRPNIHLRVDHFKTEQEKRDALVHRARWADKPGIIYTGTRKAAEEIVQALSAEGIEALYYHGGMKGKERHEIQDRFMAGEAEIIVATNAFGMGVDKPDIRFVYHYDPSDALDAYYQEIGRAGRDGEKAEAILFFRRADIGAQSFKTAEGKVGAEVLQEVAARMADGGVEPEEVGLSKRKLTSAMQRLEDAGGDVEVAAEEQEKLRDAKRERLEMMAGYAETSGCRREFLLRYLGDEFQGPCHTCDNCADSSAGTRREVT